MASLNDQSLERYNSVPYLESRPTSMAGDLSCHDSIQSEASVPFLQMVKQSNVIIVFLLSLLIGLEQRLGDMTHGQHEPQEPHGTAWNRMSL